MFPFYTPLKYYKKLYCKFIKKRLWHRCFPVNFAKFSRAHFLPNTSRLQLLYTTRGFLFSGCIERRPWTKIFQKHLRTFSTLKWLVAVYRFSLKLKPPMFLSGRSFDMIFLPMKNITIYYSRQSNK